MRQHGRTACQRNEHVSALDPCLALIKAWVFFVPKSWDPAESGSDPTHRGPDPILGIWLAPAGVPDLSWRFGLYIQRSGTLPWGSGLTVDTLEHIVFSGHVAVPELSTWWDWVLFTMRLEIAMRAPCLHTVVRGTPVSGYRQWPPGPPLGRIRACRWGQSLVGDWHAAFMRLLT
jgi:hypothetical protein